MPARKSRRPDSNRGPLHYEGHQGARQLEAELKPHRPRLRPWSRGVLVGHVAVVGRVAPRDHDASTSPQALVAFDLGNACYPSSSSQDSTSLRATVAGSSPASLRMRSSTTDLMLDLRLKLMAHVFISSASADLAIAEHVRSGAGRESQLDSGSDTRLSVRP